MNTEGKRINGIYFPPSNTCNAMIGRKEWCDNKVFKNEYCRAHYKEMKETERHTCCDCNITVYGNGNVELTDQGTQCFDCRDKQKGEKQKTAKCENDYCNELSAVGGKCLEHYQATI